jgi:hypothetical protein
MTVSENTFPLGYFYIVSKMNELVIDLREPETATVRKEYVVIVQIFIIFIGFLQNCHGSQEAYFSRERQSTLDPSKRFLDKQGYRFSVGY